MIAMQSFLLGVMVAWMPSLIVLAWLLWREMQLEDRFDRSDY
jgi:hypothetical protein